MTLSERSQILAGQIMTHLTAVQQLKGIVLNHLIAAVVEEREACAVLAVHPLLRRQDSDEAMEAVAEAIRERGRGKWA